mgnify:CR=1 FL=1
MRFIIIWLILTSININAEIYKWTDANGKVHFGDKPPASQQSEEIDQAALMRKVNSYTHVTIEIVPFDFGLKTKSNRVTMYSTQWCPYCAKARKYFAEHNIAYIEKDIDQSSKAKKEYIKFGGTGIPVIFAGNLRMNGFSAKSFAKLYKKAKQQAKTNLQSSH